MALGHGSTSKKHRKSRREGNPAEESPKPIKTLMQALWRRHSSSSANNNVTEKVSSSPRTRTLSPNQSLSPLSRKISSPTVSSLEQAQRIARGQVEENNISGRPDGGAVYDLSNETLTFQSPISTPQPPGGFLPRIPEHGESNYSPSQMERLKAAVVRRANSRSDRSEFKSATPVVYWPDGEVASQLVKMHQPQTQQLQPAIIQMDRLPRIAPLSRPSSVLFSGTRSPAMMSFCASPTRTVSPTPFLHRPLPPPPSIIDRRGDKMSKSFNFGAHRSGPMWQAIPPKSPTGEIEVIDTAVYSNVKIPLLR